MSSEVLTPIAKYSWHTNTKQNAFNEIRELMILRKGV